MTTQSGWRCCEQVRLHPAKIPRVPRSARVRTGVGTFSIHHVRPELFGGAERDPSSGVRIASREKALVDYLYLSPTRTRLFAALPELELPKGFDAREARRPDMVYRLETLRAVLAQNSDQIDDRVAVRHECLQHALVADR